MVGCMVCSFGGSKFMLWFGSRMTTKVGSLFMFDASGKCNGLFWPGWFVAGIDGK